MLTTRGRKTGTKRRLCIRAVRRGDRAYLVAIKGVEKTAWARNALAAPDVRLRVRGGEMTGVVREPRDDTEREEARAAYCDSVHPFDYLEYTMWRTGRPNSAGIRELHAFWFRDGTPLVVDLAGAADRG